MDLNDEQLSELGQALASLESAIEHTPEAFENARAHAVVVGDGLVFVLAMRGFVVSFDPERASRVAAEYERQPEQAARLS